MRYGVEKGKSINGSSPLDDQDIALINLAFISSSFGTFSGILVQTLRLYAEDLETDA